MSTIETMSTAEVWAHIVVLAIATYAIRSSFIAMFSYYSMPDQIENHLDLVPPAILAALAVPALIFRDGTYHFSPTDPFLLAGIAAGIVAWKTESLIRTIATGFVVFFGVSYVQVI